MNSSLRFLASDSALLNISRMAGETYSCPLEPETFNGLDDNGEVVLIRPDRVVPNGGRLY